GQLFSLAFPCSTVEEVDKTYDKIIARGAIPIKKPSTMPWNQRTGFFADPAGNIHEVFSDLP
nr:VOC family protein [Candidatus Brocadiales bacterium]